MSVLPCSMTTGPFLFDDTERAGMVIDQAGQGHQPALATVTIVSARGRRMTAGQPGSLLGWPLRRRRDYLRQGRP